MIRNIAKKLLYSGNTYRYEIEYPRIVAAFDEHVKTCGVLMDAGAGSGYYSSRLLHSGRCEKVIAYEPFSANFSRLQETFANDLDKVVMEERGVETIPLENDSVDVLICCQVLEHIEDHHAVAKEFGRVLKNGGYALITVPRPPEPHPQIDHVREGYLEEELDELFLHLGFEKLMNDWFYIDSSKEQSKTVKKWGNRGMYLPRVFSPKEMNLGAEERRVRTPYGLLGLYKKVDS